jgi:hypothetical protein
MKLIPVKKALSFPSAGTPFGINNSAVEKACAILGVTRPVKIKVTSAKKVLTGSWRWKNGFHGICVSRMQSREEINKTLWHELQHAADYEKLMEMREYSERAIAFRSVVSEKSAIATENKYAGNSLLV